MPIPEDARRIIEASVLEKLVQRDVDVEVRLDQVLAEMDTQGLARSGACQGRMKEALVSEYRERYSVIWDATKRVAGPRRLLGPKHESELTDLVRELFDGTATHLLESETRRGLTDADDELGKQRARALADIQGEIAAEIDTSTRKRRNERREKLLIAVGGGVVGAALRELGEVVRYLIRTISSE